MSFDFCTKLAVTADPVAARRTARIAAMRRIQERKRHVTKIRDAAPDIVKSVEKTLIARGLKKCVSRVTYRVKHTLEPDDLRSGTLQQSQYPIAAIDIECDLELWAERRAKDGVRAYPLSAEIVTCDCSLLPFDVVATLHLVRDDEDDAEYAECKFERELPAVCIARTHWSVDETVVSARKSTIVREACSVPLLGDPLHCDDIATNVRFSSIDAIGFSSTTLMMNVARKFTPLNLTTVRYIIPLQYAFSGLLRKVHAACTIAELRQTRTPLEVETEPDSTFELQRNDTHFIIDGESLNRAIAFIEGRLMCANQPFDIGRVFVHMAPFGGVSWLDAWQASLQRAAATSAAENSGRHRTSTHAAVVARTNAGSPIVITLDIVIYFVALSPHGLAAKHNDVAFELARHSAPGAVSSSSANTGVYSSVTASQEQVGLYADGTNTDEGDDDDATASTYAPPQAGVSDDDDDDDDDDEEEEAQENEEAHSE